MLSSPTSLTLLSGVQRSTVSNNLQKKSLSIPFLLVQ